MTSPRHAPKMCSRRVRHQGRKGSKSTRLFPPTFLVAFWTAW
uniref:Uncharacterized protein n=1 Tax=Lepeophtheirus salmonis TaxID=72036 RepID=A0A0K2UTJ4_LEPSM